MKYLLYIVWGLLWLLCVICFIPKVFFGAFFELFGELSEALLEHIEH